MATATNDVERIVRKVLKEEQDETINAIQELSTLLTEQVIPKLANGSDDSDWEQDEDAEQDTDQDEAVSLSAFDDEEPVSRGRKPVPNGHDDQDETDLPEQDIPRAVIEAFTSMYRTLSAEQSSALAELFTTIDSQIDDEGKADEDHDQQDQDEETRVHA
jgi:hypothetical protein